MRERCAGFMDVQERTESRDQPFDAGIKKMYQQFPPTPADITQWIKVHCTLGSASRCTDKGKVFGCK